MAQIPDRLLRNADLALYSAKRDGRGQYRFYSRDMDLELRRPLASKVACVVQSTMGTLNSCTSRRLPSPMGACGASKRWFVGRAPAVVTSRRPDLFLLLSERPYRPAGGVDLRTACRQAKAWIAAGLDRFAVNVSAGQLRQPDFASVVERILADCGLVASALELEVTESVLDPSMVVTTKALNEVAELGVTLAIDDFGTGRSSLGYLQQFPFNRIKIDSSFVRDIDAEGDLKAIVNAIIALGHGLGKAVTADGVETETQLSFLQASTCDEVQGHLLARPKAVDEIEQAFDRHRLDRLGPTLAEIQERGGLVRRRRRRRDAGIHEVMELVRVNSALSHLVMQLRDKGKSWQEVKAAIEVELRGE